jgi:hypothetical protein
VEVVSTPAEISVLELSEKLNVRSANARRTHKICAQTSGSGKRSSSDASIFALTADREIIRGYRYFFIISRTEYTHGIFPLPKLESYGVTSFFQGLPLQTIDLFGRVPHSKHYVG